jgi:hypothetical protein
MAHRTLSSKESQNVADIFNCCACGLSWAFDPEGSGAVGKDDTGQLRVSHHTKEPQ